MLFTIHTCFIVILGNVRLSDCHINVHMVVIYNYGVYSVKQTQLAC